MRSILMASTVARGERHRLIALHRSPRAGLYSLVDVQLPSGDTHGAEDRGRP